jgi:two-component system CheB/CheR fusion protein
MSESKTIASPSRASAESGDLAAVHAGGSVTGADGVAAASIVGIGASAGGLEALRQLFTNLQDDTDFAFIVIQHMDPGGPSLLADILAGDTRMPVVEVADRMRPAPNHVYVMPPHADISIDRGILALIPRSQTRNLHLPIDSFFRALADDQPGSSIGVVLSGAGSDGTEGLRAIKAAGGITFAQNPESAQFRSMPESALAAGVVDFGLSPRDIARELSRLGHDPYLARPPAGHGEDEGEHEDVEADARESGARESGILASALAAVSRHTRIDFAGYKRATVMRRIMRRMALRHLPSMSEYAHVLDQDPGEANALAQDILIHITSFFRDPAAFEVLGQHVFPALRKPDEAKPSIRIWVPGCSTGEEVYSLAICLLESLDGQERAASIRIFGSDLSEQAIATARAGVYPDSRMEHVTPERLARFFERVEGGYRISKRVRDLCVFVKHDLTRDPPFARLDLVSCRNVLIYFDAELQRRVVPMLHYCLNKRGYLFLGSSEATGAFGELFAPLDNEHRIYVKTGESQRLAFPLKADHEPDTRGPPLAGLAERWQPAREAQRQADHLLLTRFAPPGVVVNEQLDIVQFRGRTGSFLEAPPGQPQLNLLRMARAGLVAHLHEALETARAGSAMVRREGVRLTEDDRLRIVNLEVIPLGGIAESPERYFLVLFEEVAPPEAAPEASPASPASPASASVDEELLRLKAELVATRDYLQALIGDHQSATDEAGAANEELVAANEELQSINEELESAKEELQSTNEELGTVNDELRNRNQELDLVANDLANILESVEIPVIIVDQALRVRRFTPTARAISSLIPGDVGRPIEDVKLKIRVDDLAERIQKTMDTIVPREWEVQALDGRWFRLQIRPYRTVDNRLDGAILSFVDVDVLKLAVQGAEHARDYARSIVETVPISLIVLDTSLHVVSANHAFYDDYAVSPEATDGIGFFDLMGRAWDAPALREAVERTLAAGSRFRDLEIQREFPRVGRKDLTIAGCPILRSEQGSMLLLAIEDVTERRMLEASEKQARLEAEQANRAKDLFLATLSHELRTPLTAILMSAQVLQQTATKEPKIMRASAAIERAAGNQARLIEDLLDISRIVSGKFLLDLQAVDLASVVHSAVDIARGAAEAKGIDLKVAIHGALGPIHGDPARLQQVVANLLNNSIKFTPRGGNVAISLEAIDGYAQITVTDTGVGFTADILPRLFDRFVQAESSMQRNYGGLGLGLAIVRHIVEVHGGEVRAESPGQGGGATFRIKLPLATHGVAPETSAPRSVARSIAGVRVLLIEDDEDTRGAFTMMLHELGADVRAAASAAEGMAAVEEFRPNAIFCDIAMPGEDGYSFIRKLRSQGPDRGGQTPAAALTALAGKQDRERALSAGFHMHLAKPIDSARLAAAVGVLSAWTPQEDSAR